MPTTFSRASLIFSTCPSRTLAVKASPSAKRRVGRRGAQPFRAREEVVGAVHVERHGLVPPTVIPSIRIVGRPTPTGTGLAVLPHVPIPASSFSGRSPRGRRA